MQQLPKSFMPFLWYFIELKVTNAEIIFQNITFGYTEHDHIFTKKNVVIPSGEKLGLVGISGSGKTTIVIAHRLSTLAKMDRILIFDKGKIIEDGSHQELLKLKGHYWRMWNMQAGGFLPEEDE